MWLGYLLYVPSLSLKVVLTQVALSWVPLVIAGHQFMPHMVHGSEFRSRGGAWPAV